MTLHNPQNNPSSSPISDLTPIPSSSPVLSQETIQDVAVCTNQESSTNAPSSDNSQEVLCQLSSQETNTPELVSPLLPLQQPLSPSFSTTSLTQQATAASFTKHPSPSGSLADDLSSQNGDIPMLTNCAADTLREEQVSDSRMIPSGMPKVLCIYTGGTVGMKYSKRRGYVPAKNFLFQYLKSHPTFSDSTYQQSNQFTHLQSDTSISDPIITPASIYDKRICMQILEFSPLLDSSNMTMEQWVKIASEVERYYSHFDAFLILHGTDTMAFTASALSFMLENLSKPVILTGSQIPLSEQRNDGVENILGALTIAGHYCIPEVCIYFNNKLFRGNRCSKVSAIDLDAFDSPNMKPLVTVNTQIEVDWNAIIHPNGISSFKVHKSLNPNVATIRMFPGITESAVRAFVAPPIQGIVIEAFGSGNLPSNRPEILQILEEACNRGVVIVNCTQCRKGRVSEIYATARQLSMVGIVFGSDMTPECALTKLSYCLGKYSIEETRNIIGQDLRGELTVQKMHRFSLHPISLTLDSCKEDMQILKQYMMNLLVCNAAGTNDIPTMTELINCGASPNCVDYSKRSPLHIAASLGHVKMCEFLVCKGGNIHAKDGFDNLPIWEAMRNKHTEVVTFLYGKGARLSQGNNDTYNAFYESIIKNDNELVDQFISLGINIERCTIEGSTPYDLAMKSGNFRIAELLRGKQSQGTV